MERRGAGQLTAADARRFGTEVALLVDLVFGDDAEQRALLEARLAEFIDNLGPDRLTSAQERVAVAGALRTGAVIRHHLGDVEQWEHWLRTVASRLGDLREAAAGDLEPGADAGGHPDAIGTTTPSTSREE